MVSNEGMGYNGNGQGTPLAMAAQMWPTPNVPNGGRAMDEETVEAKGASPRGKRQVDLGSKAALWRTPSDDSQRGGATDGEARVAQGHTLNLQDQVAVWPTPGATEGEKGPSKFAGGNPSLTAAAKDWPTPTSADGHGAVNPSAAKDWESRGTNLPEAAVVWQTPGTDSFRGRGGDRKDEAGLSRQAREHVTSGQPSSPSGPTSRPRLNPAFVEWLMGWPETWSNPHAPTDFASWVTESSRLLRRLLSSPWRSEQAS